MVEVTFTFLNVSIPRPILVVHAHAPFNVFKSATFANYARADSVLGFVDTGSFKVLFAVRFWVPRL